MSSHEISPLRYPGGKGDIAPFLGRLIASQERAPDLYVEPFAGGAGAAMRLLCDEFVDHIVINDLDAGIAAFWRSVFRHTEDLARRVETVEVTVDTWHQQAATYRERASRHDDLSLGFATFFLNRTNRSGILGARPIGGLAQTGKWKLDARFNRANLAGRIRTLGRYRNRVTVLEEDGLTVLRRFLGARAFTYADPPYLGQGVDLYLDTLTWTDHQALASLLAGSDAMWMLTYDNDPRVRELYPGHRRAVFPIGHTAANPHVGREIVVFAESVKLGGLSGFGSRRPFTWAETRVNGRADEC